MSESLDSAAWSPAAVFSPSLARQQQKQAQDWAFVDAFLRQKYAPRPPPPFERNADTLKILFALATASEQAEDERRVLMRAKRECLGELQAAVNNVPEPVLQLAEVLDSGTHEALQATAGLALALGSVDVTPIALATKLIDLTRQEFKLQQSTLQVEGLKEKLEARMEALKMDLKTLQSEAYQLPEDLPARASDWLRQSKHLAQKAAEYESRAASLDAQFSRTNPGKLSLPALIEQERSVQALSDEVILLETQARAYQGLPADKDLARLELERVTRELQALMTKREALYDRMIAGK